MNPRKRERLCLLEDARAVLYPLLSRLGFEPEVRAAEPAELLEALAARLPAIALLDLSQRKQEQCWVINTLRRQYPRMKIVVLARGAGPGAVQDLKLLGASEVLADPRLTDSQLEAVFAQLSRPGRMARRGARRDKGLPRFESLTPREREVLGHISDGADNLKVASALGISERTVKAHVSSIFRKVGAENRVALALAARGFI